MIDQILSEGSLGGMILLFFGIFVFGHISGNTKTRMADAENFENEVALKFGIDSESHPFTHSANAFLGIAATFWLPIYTWIISSFWAGLIVFICQLFMATFLSMIINGQAYYMLWRIAPIMTITGFALTTKSLF